MRQLRRKESVIQPDLALETAADLRPVTLIKHNLDQNTFDRDHQQEFLFVLSSRPEHTLLRQNKFSVKAEYLLSLMSI